MTGFVGARNGMNTLALLVAASACAAASFARAQTYGLDFVTIGDAGNRDTLPDESPWNPDQRIGGVDYEYRIARNKLSTLDHLVFARAYAPYYAGDINDRDFLGNWLTARPDGFGGWVVDAAPGTEGYAASLSWEMAARYCNWLHNGKADAAWAFEDGAYDSSTFYRAEGRYLHQETHHPDAKFWIPTLDEYAKAVYWDPDKNSGDGGYWLNPDGGDERLFVALPEDGGETIGDLYYDDGYFFGTWDLNQYTDIRSPWGLLDVSGTLPDWLEAYSNSTRGSRKRGGSQAHDIFFFAEDRIDNWNNGDPVWIDGALRIVTTVPTPGSLSLMLGCVCGVILKRQRT